MGDVAKRQIIGRQSIEVNGGDTIRADDLVALSFCESCSAVLFSDKQCCDACAAEARQ